ncbi:hypothetical protein HK099_000815 [Clydaea vesicula]|uniref:Wilms tumor protein homolog n=1 Tax=Clydaea vesicula TaxID=447962 RepID=A0AAD5XXF8_9FUNG|nr:hypothetical protein HK099_000815 [Clydaea vesicula]KAJ3397829.1 hypothetical protein HDU92_002501 [Lobulomyces angularis]
MQMNDSDSGPRQAQIIQSDQSMMLNANLPVNWGNLHRGPSVIRPDRHRRTTSQDSINVSTLHRRALSLSQLNSSVQPIQLPSSNKFTTIPLPVESQLSFSYNNNNNNNNMQPQHHSLFSLNNSQINSHNRNRLVGHKRAVSVQHQYIDRPSSPLTQNNIINSGHELFTHHRSQSTHSNASSIDFMSGYGDRSATPFSTTSTYNNMASYMNTATPATLPSPVVGSSLPTDKSQNYRPLYPEVVNNINSGINSIQLQNNNNQNFENFTGYSSNDIITADNFNEQLTNNNWNGHQRQQHLNSLNEEDEPSVFENLVPVVNKIFTEDGIKTCLWADCDHIAISNKDLVEHLSVEHILVKKGNYVCEWKDCNRGHTKGFAKRHKLLQHMRTHTGERPYLCTSEGCGKRFARQDGLNTHEKTHLDVKPFICNHPNCGKAYYHSRSLRKHSRVHQNDDNIPLGDVDTEENIQDFQSDIADMVDSGNQSHLLSMSNQQQSQFQSEQQENEQPTYLYSQSHFQHSLQPQQTFQFRPQQSNQNNFSNWENNNTQHQQNISNDNQEYRSINLPRSSVNNNCVMGGNSFSLRGQSNSTSNFFSPAELVAYGVPGNNGYDFNQT